MSKSRKTLWEKRKNNNLCVYCGQSAPKLNRKGCENCLVKKSFINGQYSKKNKDRKGQARLLLKYEVIEKYGGKCNCCGENQILFLTIDHVLNDGNKDRLKLFGRKNPNTTGWYYKLKRENVRNDLQVLCYNCNMGKYLNKGVCPHKKVNVFLSEKYDHRHDSQFDTRLKITWPSDEDLIAMCNNTSTSQVARFLNVDYTAVSGRLKRRNKFHLVTTKYGGNLKGEENPAAKLTKVEVNKIRNSYENGVKRKDLASEYKVSKALIDKIVTYKIWKI